MLHATYCTRLEKHVNWQRLKSEVTCSSNEAPPRRQNRAAHAVEQKSKQSFKTSNAVVLGHRRTSSIMLSGLHGMAPKLTVTADG